MLVLLHCTIAMFKWAIFLTLVTYSYAAPGLRIVNGTNAREGEFPFAVSLRNNLRHTCGGTILNDRRILTAAHCICANNTPNDAQRYTIQYGSVRISQTTERSVQVSKIHCHNFSDTTLNNDVAVLELAHAIPHDGSWQAVRLTRSFDTAVSTNGVVIGWGMLWHQGPIPEILQKLNVDIYADWICGLRFDQRQHVCFGAAVGGACNGDSGTSLLSLDNQQIAVASFITNTCGTATAVTPNVYARVSYFYDWIQSHLH